jgi:hypothetical protein
MNHLEEITAMAQETTAAAVKDVGKHKVHVGHMEALRINIDVLYQEIYKVYHGGMSKFYRDVATTNYRAFSEQVTPQEMAGDFENLIFPGLLAKAKLSSMILLKDHYEQTMDQLNSGMSQKDEIINQALGQISTVLAASAKAAAMAGPTKPAGPRIIT